MNKKKESLIVVGIDVSKDTLDTSEFNGEKYKMLKIENSMKSITRFKSQKKFVKNKENYLFVMEATGVYSSLLTYELYKDNFKVAVVNPLIIKRFAEMKMIRAKTDNQDAKTIALYGYEQSTKLKLYAPRSNEQQESIRILKSIEDFENVITTLTNQLKAFEIDPIQSQLVLRTLKTRIRSIEKDIKILETELYKILYKIYPNEIERLIDIKGVGKKTAAIILAFFGKFETFENAKQVVSYIGTNPRINDSGTSVKGKGRIEKKGNKYIRTKLFMSALSTSRYNPSCKALYQRLTLKGKEHKQKRVAVLNKLMRQIFAVLKYDRIWDPNYCLAK